jgi:hypothetical protein
MKFMMLVCVERDRFEQEAAAEDASGAGDGGSFPWLDDMLECANLAEAVQVAAAHPVAAFGKIEVREVWSEEP